MLADEIRINKIVKEIQKEEMHQTKRDYATCLGDIKEKIQTNSGCVDIIEWLLNTLADERGNNG